MALPCSILYLFVLSFVVRIVTIEVEDIVFHLSIRENGKICSPWMYTGDDPIAYEDRYHRECISETDLEVKNGEARLCCESVPLTTPSTNFPRQCGKQQYQPLKQRIVGGVHATASSWPWQVLLLGSDIQCGGVLIDQQHVLTAAHCIRLPIEPIDYQVTVGLHDRNSIIYMEQEIVAEKIWVHEEFNSSTLEHDISVIRLSKPVQISDTVNIICLPGAEVGKLVNQTVWVSGWGRTAYRGSGSPVLKQTWLHTMGDRCHSYVTKVFDEEKQLCAGRYTNDSNICHGDSGGPLMYESNGQWFLNGITSYTTGCGQTGIPSVFVRVSYYLPWIRSKMTSA